MTRVFENGKATCRPRPRLCVGPRDRFWTLVSSSLSFLYSENNADEETDERHVTSVFPSEGRSVETDAVQELKASVGNRFISETQLKEASESGLTTRDAHGQSGKSLAVILAENKQKKEEEFQEQWRAMKQGKNRPLDSEDYEFVDALYKEEAKKVRAQFDHAQRDADEFKKACEELAAEKSPRKKLPAPIPSTRKKAGWSLKPQLRVVSRKRSSTVSATDRTRISSKKSADVPEAKRVKE